MGDSHKVKLSRLVAQGITKLRYTYDMGDSWEHTIQIEKTLPAETGVHYPRCMTGKRACPPEDCGGVWGYADLLDLLKNPDDPDYEERREWVSDEFDAEAFDLEQVNGQLH